MTLSSRVPLLLIIMTQTALFSAPHNLEGPLPGIQPWPSNQPIHASEDVGAKGSLSFWVYFPQGFFSGLEASTTAYELIKGPVQVSLRTEPRFITLLLHPGDGNPMPSMRLQLPGLPGPAWYHLAFEWDAVHGYVNMYVNGSKIRQSDESIGSWSPVPIDRLEPASDLFLFAGVTLRPENINPARLKQEVTQFYFGSVDQLIGARSLGTLDLAPLRGTLLYENNLADAASVADWIMEGDALVSFKDGWMTMASQRPDGVPEHGHWVFWYPNKLPDSFVAEWEFQPLEKHGLCIVFFAALGIDGQSIFDASLADRNGHFPQYHSGDINAYHISYFANTPNEPGRATSNLRKNSGFQLVSNGPPGVPSGSLQPHHIVLVKDANHIRMAVDGNLIIDWIDTGTNNGPALDEGYIGLRQMQWTVGRYRNFKVYNLKSSASRDGE